MSILAISVGGAQLQKGRKRIQEWPFGLTIQGYVYLITTVVPRCILLFLVLSTRRLYVVSE